MDSFYKFWDKINGEMYKDIPPPVKYNFAPYIDNVGGYELKPLSHEDTASYAADDVVNWYKTYGKNTTKLGPPMSDEELKRHYGQTW